MNWLRRFCMGIPARLSPPAARAFASRAKASGERGAEILEFAFVLISLLALLLGIFTFARAYNVFETMTRAAREGAHMASLPTSVYDGNTFIDGNNSSVSQASSVIFSNYISPALLASNLNPASVTNYSETIGWMDQGDTNEQCGIIISFDYPYQLAVPFLGANLGTLTLRTRVQMRRENQPIPSSSGAVTCP